MTPLKGSVCRSFGSTGFASCVENGEPGEVEESQEALG